MSSYEPTTEYELPVALNHDRKLARRVRSWCGEWQQCVEVFDFVLLTFIMVFVRQYLWGVSNQTLAWTLTISLSLIISGAHIYARGKRESLPSKKFWLVVGLPLLLAYSMRAAFPDMDYDVLNYHLVNTERGLKGWPFIPGDFFSTVLLVNPAPDMVAGIFQRVLGFRLGTLVNYFAILWVALIIERFLRPYVRNEWLRVVSVLFIVSTEYMLYMLSMYRIDLLALPLLLEATHLALRPAEIKNRNYILVSIALYLGISSSFKLSNVMFAIPITLICLYSLFSLKIRIKPKYLALAAFAFVLPLIPYSLYMYVQTGSPVFPFFNGLFKVPYYLGNSDLDPTYGPDTFWEKALWPIWSFFYPERVSEMSGIGNPYTGRIALGFIISALCLFYKSVSREVKMLSFATVLSAVFWSVLTGNVRYALYIELAGGIVIVCLAASLYRATKELGQHRAPKFIILLVLFGGLLSAQTIVSYRLFLRNSPMLWMKTTQPTAIKDFNSYHHEAQEFLSDRSIHQYLSPEDKERFGKVEVWINSYYTTSGVEVLLRPDVPMLAVCDYIGTLDYLRYDASKEKFANTLPLVSGKRMFSLTRITQGHLHDSMFYITRTGLTIGEITPVSIPYFSTRRPIRMYLIEVLPPGKGAGKEEISELAMKYALVPDDVEAIEE